MSEQIRPNSSANPAPAEIITVRPAAPAMAGLFDEPAGGLAPVEPGRTANAVDLGQILRFKRTILVIFLVMAVPSLTAIWALITPRYSARGEIMVRPIIPSLVFRTEENGMIPLYESYKNTQVAVILSPVVLQRVLDEPEVQKTDWYRLPESSLFGGTDLPMERLKEDLEVRPRGQTEIIDVTMLARKSRDATIVVNAVLEQYLKYVRESSDKNRDMLYQQLVEQFDTLRGEIEGQEKLIARLCKELGTSTPDALVHQKRVRLDELEAKLQALDQEIATCVWQEKQIEELGTDAQAKKTASSQPSMEIRYTLDDSWRQLYMSLQSAQHDLETAQGQLGKEHPRITELASRIQFIQTQLRNRQDQLDKEWACGINVPPGLKEFGGGSQADAETQRHNVKKLQYDRELLFSSLEKQRASFEETFSRAQMLTKESDAVRRKRELYNAIRSRLDEKEMERKVPGSIDINAQAMPSRRPASDRRRILSIMALMGSLMAGAAVAFLRVSFNRTVQEAEEINRSTHAPFLGRLPLLPPEVAKTIEEDPIQAEHVRMIRTSLLQRLAPGSGHTILITSAVPGEGKTTTTTMLAKSLALIGKKVLLVDADLRNPSLSKRFADLQAGTASGTEAALGLIATGTPGLTVLPTQGLRHGMNAEFFSNGAFAEWLNRWRSEYDLVLLDTSPVLPVADARILSRQVDGTILLVREGWCLREDVKDALAYLGVSGAKLLGTIFIGSDRRTGYGTPYNRYYHNYYQKTTGNS